MKIKKIKYSDEELISKLKAINFADGALEQINEDVNHVYHLLARIINYIGWSKDQVDTLLGQ